MAVLLLKLGGSFTYGAVGQVYRKVGGSISCKRGWLFYVWYDVESLNLS